MLQLAVDPGQIEKVMPLLERGPITFVAAVFFLAAVALLTLFVRHVEKAKTRAARDARVHAEQTAALQKAFSDKLELIHARELERSTKLELSVHGLLELDDALGRRERELDERERLFEERARPRGRKPTTDPKLRLPAKGKPDDEP